MTGAMLQQAATPQRFPIFSTEVVSNGFIGIGATAIYSLVNNGNINQSTDAGTSDIGDWILPKTNFSAYEAKVTMISGSLTSGTSGSWLSLGTTRDWEFGAVGPGASVSFTLEIRGAASTAVVASATITLSVFLT